MNDSLFILIPSATASIIVAMNMKESVRLVFASLWIGSALIAFIIMVVS